MSKRRVITACMSFRIWTQSFGDATQQHVRSTLIGHHIASTWHVFYIGCVAKVFVSCQICVYIPSVCHLYCVLSIVFLSACFEADLFTSVHICCRLKLAERYRQTTHWVRDSYWVPAIALGSIFSMAGVGAVDARESVTRDHHLLCQSRDVAYAYNWTSNTQACTPTHMCFSKVDGNMCLTWTRTI